MIVAVIAAVVVALSALYGAGSQYAGSLIWVDSRLTEISLLSAPWLLLPFLAGSAQTNATRAALLGLIATYAGLAGYGAMTLSPIEGAEYTSGNISAFIRSQALYIAGGTFTGPLFGWFGQRWRVHRDWRGALLTACAISLEPLMPFVRSLIPIEQSSLFPAARALTSSTVVVAEVVLGVAMAIYVLAITKWRGRGSVPMGLNPGSRG